MNRISLSLLCAALALGISGCTIVKDVPPDEKAIPTGASGDQARTEIRIKETFDSKLLPYVRDNATPIADLRKMLVLGLEQAGENHGHKGSGEGAAWNFPVSGSGKVVSAKLDTRARSVSVDTTGDGKADVTVQLGPVILGSALRDAAPFYNYDDFRDQIEFAKLSRAINDRISKLLEVPDGDLVGKTASFVGVVPLKSTTEAYVVTPIVVEFTP